MSEKNLKGAFETRRQRFFLKVVLPAVSLLWFAGATPAAARVDYMLHGCHWGYANNCQFSTYRQCMQSNIWALILDFCTPPLSQRARRAYPMKK
jgi:hypothetical protein